MAAPRPLADHAALTGRDRAALALIRHAARTGRPFPSLFALAGAAECHPDTVSGILRRLEDAGELIIERCWTGARCKRRALVPGDAGRLPAVTGWSGRTGPRAPAAAGRRA